MTNAQGLIVPDVEQSIAFHEALMRRLGVEDAGPVDRASLERTLERLYSMVQSRERDIFWLGAYLIFDFIKGKVFGKGSAQTGIALPLAFLYRNGIMIVPPEPAEIADLGFAIMAGDVYVAVLEEWLKEYARRAS